MSRVVVMAQVTHTLIRVLAILTVNNVGRACSKHILSRKGV